MLAIGDTLPAFDLLAIDNAQRAQVEPGFRRLGSDFDPGQRTRSTPGGRAQSPRGAQPR
ncbi:hypothetical protein HP532_23865 [Pseudomonas sp. CrR25]|nr:hypothetical protein [Pseudomonas sp. CrR25]